jgi:hypothetical protein
MAAFSTLFIARLDVDGMTPSVLLSCLVAEHLCQPSKP